MKLMRLSPLSQRLRRVARAHAAGETSIADYRQARRQLLAEVVPLPARKVDDTHRRGEVADITRRTATHPRQAQNVSKEGSDRRTEGQRKRPVRYRWLIGSLGALLAILWVLLKA